jgi:nicotinate dehydrogenase subunit B
MLTQEPGFSRREFLKTSGALVVTFSLGNGAADAALNRRAAQAVGKTVALTEVDGFLAIGADGSVTVYSGKVDLGTGIRTAMTQIAAEELSVPLDKVEVIEGDTALTPDQGVTFGSLSIQIGGMQIRQAAATARAALMDEGARKLGLSRDDVIVRLGRVYSRIDGKNVEYGDLVGGKNFSLKVDPNATLKDPAGYTIVGKPVQRLDIPDKVTAKFTYMQDFKVPGMLHARVVRPAAVKASLLSFDDSAAKQVPGYVATVRKENFLAVLAKNEWAAIKASQSVKAQWSDWQGLPDKAKL